jgi:hypothetical protein
VKVARAAVGAVGRRQLEHRGVVSLVHGALGRQLVNMFSTDPRTQVLCCIGEISPVANSATRKAIPVAIEAMTSRVMRRCFRSSGRIGWRREPVQPGTAAEQRLLRSLVSLWCFAPIHEGELGNRDHDPNKTQRCERSAPKVSHGRPLQNPSWCRVV